MATPLPTATQLFADEQLTDFISGSPAGTVLDVHVLPSLLEIATIPDRLESPPTAMHRDTVGQVTASKAPTPRVAPPGIGIDGALSSFCGVDHGDGIETPAFGLSVPADFGGDPMAKATEVKSSPAAAIVIVTRIVPSVKGDRLRELLPNEVLDRVDTVVPLLRRTLEQELSTQEEHLKNLSRF